MGGKADGLGELYPLTIDQMRAGLPGLVGGIELEGVGHWVHHEASAEVNAQLVKFLSAVHPI
jgi:pimeloyl-ACP methyl ester carboxylesterase